MRSGLLILSLISFGCSGQPAVVGGGELWAGGISIPWLGAQAARDFPQGTPKTPGYALGISAGQTAHGLAPEFMALGIHRRFKVFHAAVLGSALGDPLYSEYGFGVRSGLSTPKWALGLGLDRSRRKIEHRVRTGSTISAGISLFWNQNTSLHLRSSFLARQSLDDPLFADGFSSAWLINHKMGRTLLMGFLQQWETKGWDAGIACLFTLTPNWEATVCGSSLWRRFSLGLKGHYKSWHISVSGMISPLPFPGSLIDLQYEPENRSP